MDRRLQLLVRNKVEDFDHWRDLFMSDIERAKSYGISLSDLWRSESDENNVFFTLDIESVARTEEFMASKESQEIGEKSGVIDGEFTFLHKIPVS